MSGTTGNPKPTDLVIAGKRLHAWTGGAGQALLLLHSAWGDAEMSWAPVWNELSRSFTVIAPDLPGFGASDPLDGPTLSANANILKTLLDDQKTGPAIVVGNSFAASIAIEFAASFPERAKHLVLVNGGYLPALPGFMKKLLRLRAVEERFRRFMRSFTYSDKAFAKAFPDPVALPPGFFDRIRKNEDEAIPERLRYLHEPDRAAGAAIGPLDSPLGNRRQARYHETGGVTSEVARRRGLRGQ